MEIETQNAAEKAESDISLAITKQAKKNMESELCSLLSSHMGVSESEIYVVAEINTDDFSAVEITKITVFLADTSRGEAARKYLSDIFAGAVPIDIMKKGE